MADNKFENLIYIELKDKEGNIKETNEIYNSFTKNLNNDDYLAISNNNIDLITIIALGNKRSEKDLIDTENQPLKTDMIIDKEQKIIPDGKNTECIKLTRVWGSDSFEGDVNEIGLFKNNEVNSDNLISYINFSSIKKELDDILTIVLKIVNKRTVVVLG